MHGNFKAKQSLGTVTTNAYFRIKSNLKNYAQIWVLNY